MPTGFARCGPVGFFTDHALGREAVMAVRIHGWAGLALATALAAGCGSGGTGPGDYGVSPGPSQGQNPGFGVREESPGRGFDKADEHQESPGGRGESPGAPGGPGPGGGGGAGDLAELCIKACQRVSNKCGPVGGSCQGNCSILVQLTECRSEVKAFLKCAEKAEISCTQDGAGIIGCDDEEDDLDACLGFGPGNWDSAGEDDRLDFER